MIGKTQIHSCFREARIKLENLLVLFDGALKLSRLKGLLSGAKVPNQFPFVRTLCPGAGNPEPASRRDKEGKRNV
jgi:hypothetical protein